MTTIVNTNNRPDSVPARAMDLGIDLNLLILLTIVHIAVEITMPAKIKIIISLRLHRSSIESIRSANPHQFEIFTFYSSPFDCE